MEPRQRSRSGGAEAVESGWRSQKEGRQSRGSGDGVAEMGLRRRDGAARAMEWRKRFCGSECAAMGPPSGEGGGDGGGVVEAGGRRRNRRVGSALVATVAAMITAMRPA